jgi:hypothetical protein
MKVLFKPILGMEILPIALGVLVVIVSSSAPEYWPIAVALLTYGGGGYYYNRRENQSTESQWLPIKDKTLWGVFGFGPLWKWSVLVNQLDTDLQSQVRSGLAAAARIRVQYADLGKSRREFWLRYVSESDHALEILSRAVRTANAIKAASLNAYTELMGVIEQVVTELDTISERMAIASTSIDMDALTRGLEDTEAAIASLNDRIESSEEIRKPKRHQQVH